MGWLPDQQIPEINYGKYLPSFAAPQERSTLGSAFRQENDVLNIIDYLSQPAYPADPNFDFGLKAKDNPFFQHNPDAFIGVQSESEWAFREMKLSEEIKDRQKIASSGAGGIIAGIMAGILSPTILIPVGGEIRAGGSVALSAGRAAAWTAFGAALQEGALHVNQDERTFQESAIGVASAAVLGGLLGGAVSYATNKEFAKMAEDMAHPENTLTIQPITHPEPVGLSAQATPKDLVGATGGMIDPEGIAPGIGLPSALKALNVDKLPVLRSIAKATSMEWMGPITRGIASKSAIRRAVTAQFGSAGLYTDAAVKGIAVAEEGFIEQLAKQHFYYAAEVNNRQKALFRSWFKSTNRGSAFRSLFPTHAYNDYLEAVGNTVFERIQGKVNPGTAPELIQAADDYIENVFKREIKTAKEVGMDSWVQLKDETYALQIATQRIRRDMVAQNYNDVRHIMLENAREVLAARVTAKEFEEGVAGIIGKGKKATQLTEAELQDFAETIVDQVLPTMLGEASRHGAIDVLHKYGEKIAKFIYIDPTVKWSNGRTWSEFLEKDVEKLSRGYVRSMSSDIELWRKFGTVAPAEIKGVDVKINESKQNPFWTNFLEEQAARREAADSIIDEKLKKKELEAIAQEAADFRRDLAVLVGRIRHTHGMPIDPTSFGHRAARVALQLNTQRLMGGVMIASFADPARPIMKAGLLNTFKHGFIPLVKDFSRFRMSVRETKYAGTALDVAMHGRSGMMFDLFDELEHGNMFERFMQYGTSRIGIVGLFDYWNAAMKQFAGSVWMGTLADAIDAAGKGTLTKWQKTMLAGVNIDEYTAQAMDKLIKNGGGAEVHPGVWLPNTEEWSQLSDETILQAVKDRLGPKFDTLGEDELPELLSQEFHRMHKQGRSLQRTFRAAMAQLVDDTIVTPGVERPNWVDASSAGRLISQFRSFTLSSTTKVAQAMGQDARIGNMAPVVLGSMFSLAMGALSYYTWAHTVGGRTREKMQNELDAALSGDGEALGRWADEAFNRSGLMGVLSEVQKFGERVPGMAPYVTFAGKAPSRSPYINPVFDAFGPTGNIIDNLGNIVMTYDDPNSSTFRSAKQLLPYQNLFYIRQALDWINDAAQKKAGVSQ